MITWGGGGGVPNIFPTIKLYVTREWLDIRKKLQQQKNYDVSQL